MDCRTISEIMMQSMDGPLNETDAADLAHHVNQCPACKREYEEWISLAQALDQLPMPEPSQGFEHRVMASIDPLLYKESAKNINVRVRNPVVWLGAIGLLSLILLEAGRWLHQTAYGWLQGTHFYQGLTMAYETAIVRSIFYFLMPQRWLIDWLTHFETNYQWWHALGVINLVMILLLIKVSLDRLLAGGRREAR
jgi:hypothetical protein